MYTCGLHRAPVRPCDDVFMNTAVSILRNHMAVCSLHLVPRCVLTYAGRTFGVILQFCVGFYAFGSCTSYVVLTADFIVGPTGVFNAWAPNTLLDGETYSRTVVLVGVAVLIFLPLYATLNPHHSPVSHRSFYVGVWFHFPGGFFHTLTVKYCERCSS